jgi:hypothetical protein
MLICCAVLMLGCAQAPRSVSWHQVTGGDFTLASCGDEDATLTLAKNLRETRATLVGLLPQIPERDRVPFSVYLFCRTSDYVEFAPQPGQANHFVLGLRGERVYFTYETQQVATRTSVRGTHMAVREPQLRTAVDLVQHHYIHHLIRAHSEVPLWIEEGLAGFVGTTLLEPGGVRRGRPSYGMYDLDGLETQVPLGRVFRATDLRTWPDTEQIFFYRSSWLFTHYLHFGNLAREEEPAPRLRRFTESYAAGAHEQEAARAAFGMGTVGLRSALDRYISVRKLLLRNGKVEAPRDASGGAGLAIARVSAHDRAYGLAGFALENGDAELALRWFDAAVGAEPGSAIAHAGRARALALMADWPAAAIALERADERAADDPRVLLDGAAVLTARAASKSAAADDRAAARLRAEGVARESDLAEANYRVARSYAEGPARLAALERAHAASPGAIEVAFAYAQALAYEGRVEEAHSLGTRVAGWVLGELRDSQVYAFLDGLPDMPDVAARE